VVLNPGTSNREAKRWFPERFAAVGDRCAGEFGAVVAVNGSPTERGVVDAVHAAAKLPLLDLDRLGVDIRLLKGVLSLASLVVSNDTGTRHLAAALGTPCVSVFGPTDPALSHLGLAHDRHVRIEVPCGPCERDRCPLRDPAAHLACLRGVEVERVMAEARLWIGRRPPGHTPSSTTQAPPQALPRPDR
jgi:ADP-heptose:LPS heptosyltransferase